MRCIFQSAKLRTNTHTYRCTHTRRPGCQAVFINYKLRADYTHYKRFFSRHSRIASSLSLSFLVTPPTRFSFSLEVQAQLSWAVQRPFNWLAARWLACACLLDIIYEPIVCLLLLISPPSHCLSSIQLSSSPAIPSVSCSRLSVNSTLYKLIIAPQLCKVKYKCRRLCVARASVNESASLA